jgi:hypothetical protein
VQYDSKSKKYVQTLHPRVYIGRGREETRMRKTERVAPLLRILEVRCSIPKAMVGWERRMWNALTERKVLSALEHLRIELQVHSNIGAV